MSSRFQFSRYAFRSYQKHRPRNNRKVACLAPSENIFFGLRGQVYSCCVNKTYPIGKYPEQTIDEIWKGVQRASIVKAMRKRDFSLGCQMCYQEIASRNFAGMATQKYEQLPLGKSKFPSMMEFELENTCNLECVMCRGEFSSAIRRNREKLPPIPSAYGPSFLKELEPYLPHLERAHFLGGEPFLIGIYLDMWEMIRDVNPDMEISLQTNGTILSDRIRRLISNFNFSIGLSLDSIEKGTYEVVRKNGNFDQVMENVREIREYCKRNGSHFSISYCPMPSNWSELPEVIAFCNGLDCPVFFNTVHHPKHCSLTSLNEQEMAQVLKYLVQNQQKLPAATAIEKMNLNAYEGVVNEIRQWLAEGRFTNVTYDSLQSYLAAMDAFIHSQFTGTLVVSMQRDISEKLHYLLEVATEKGYGEEALSKILEVPFQDVCDFAYNTERKQLLENFRAFVLPMD